MKLRKIFSVTLILIPVIFLAIHLLLKFSWLTLYDSEDMKYNASIVDSSFSQPDNFLKVWDKLYPESRNNGMNKQLWSDLTRGLKNSTYYNCACDEIGYLAWTNDNHNFKFNMDRGVGKYRQFGYGLQYYTNPTKCFDFWINNEIIWNGHYLNDLNELSQIHFKKNVENLNESEIIELITYRNLGFYRSRDTILFKGTVVNLTAKLRDNNSARH